MPKLHIAIIHGIGKNGPGFSKDLTDKIAKEFNGILVKILKTSEDYSKDLNFIEIVWDDILAINQAKLADIFRKEFLKRDLKEKAHIFAWVATYLGVVAGFHFIFRNPWLMAIFAFVMFFLGKTMLEKLRTGIAAEFINDIISYRDPIAQKLIFERIKEKLKPLVDASKNETHVHFISHSLGTVIASDYVWTAQKSGDLFDQRLSLSNFFTMGSPLALFSLQFGGPEIFSKPITIQDPDGRWVNIYDNDDPIAYPLKCLNDAYDRAVLKDQEVNVGWFGLAHVNYWKSKKVAKIIARKFALDWLKLNGKISNAEFQEMLGSYDKKLRLERIKKG